MNMNAHVAPHRRLVIPNVYYTLTWSESGEVVGHSEGAMRGILLAAPSAAAHGYQTWPSIRTGG